MSSNVKIPAASLLSSRNYRISLYWRMKKKKSTVVSIAKKNTVKKDYNSNSFLQLCNWEICHSITDAFSLGWQRNSTKFAINCSLSADVVIQSVSRTTYFSVTQLNNKKIYPAETCRVLKCLTHFEIKDNTKHCLQNAYTKMSLPNVNSCCLFLAVKTKMSVPAV